MLRFPNEAVLELAITSRIVPGEVAFTSVEGGADDEGAVWLNPSVPIGRPVLAALKKLGVQQKKNSRAVPETLRCWHQLLSLERIDVPPSDQQKVLFLFRDGRELPETVTEMLRLGNDRQRIAWLTDPNSRSPDVGLLCVDDPPQYTLLRAIDAAGGPLAFTTPMPRIWVEYGFCHPLTADLQPPANQWLLIHSNRCWQWIEAPEMTDVYQLTDFKPAGEASVYLSKSPPDRIEVPVRLRQSSRDEPAELWVLQNDAMAQMESLVQNSDDELLTRLAFAVTETPGSRSNQPMVILRVRPSTSPPPSLVLNALACRSYLRIPHLFVPVGQQLQPPLRRDAVMRLLAERTDQIHWLVPQSAFPEHSDTLPGSSASNRPTRQSATDFSLHSVEDTAFRPLGDWIDYVIDSQAAALNTWIASHQFDFESFVCPEDQPDRAETPKPPPDFVDFRIEKASPDDGHCQNLCAADAVSPEPTEQQAPDPRNLSDRLATRVRTIQVPPAGSSASRRGRDEWSLKLQQLEKRYRTLGEPLDSSDRTELWLEMGEVNSQLKHPQETTICFANALWGSEVQPLNSQQYSDWSQRWYQSELRNAGIGELDEVGLDARLSGDETNLCQPGLIVSKMVNCVARGGDKALLTSRRGALSDYLLRHEPQLPVRAAWLAWFAMHLFNEGDLLMLVRARDRLLERLFHGGLASEIDLPAFMRSVASDQSDRFRVLRDWVSDFHRLVREWVVEPESSREAPQTKSCVDLIFAYALARLGNGRVSHELLAGAADSLTGKDAVHRWVLDAYSARIRQAFRGQSLEGPLTDEFMKRLEGLDSGQRYVVDRLRQCSRILEPHAGIDPFSNFLNRASDGLSRELSELLCLRDSVEIVNRLEAMLGQYGDPRVRLRILPLALQMGPRLGESYARELIEHVWPTMQACEKMSEKAALLHHAILLVAHYGLSDLFIEIVRGFEDTLPAIVFEYRSLSPGERCEADAIEALLSQALRAMRQLGMHDEIDQFHRRLAELLDSATDECSQDPQLNRLSLRLAAGWYGAGQCAAAREITDRISRQLQGEAMLDPPKVRLVCSYLNAVSNAPPEELLARLMAMFSRDGGICPANMKVGTSLMTDSHFSILQIEVVEAAVMSLLGEDFVISGETRCWMDEDELLVRQRIHRDVRMAMEGRLA